MSSPVEFGGVCTSPGALLCGDGEVSMGPDFRLPVQHGETLPREPGVFVALFLTLPLSLGELFLHLLSCREGKESCELVWGARFLRPVWQQHLLLVGNCKGRWIWETRAGPAESSCPSFYTGRFSPLPTSESQGRFYFRCWHSAR